MVTPDMAALLRVLLGLGGSVTAGTLWALPYHHRTRQALVDRGYVVSNLLFLNRTSPFHDPDTGKSLYRQAAGAYSVARVYFVSPAGAAALAEYDTDRDAAGAAVAEAGLSRFTPQDAARHAASPDADAG